MPTNVTHEYRAAEATYKAAKELPERVAALQEMLRVIPKHKGTDHLCGQLKKKLSQLRDEQRTSSKKGGRRADPGHVPSQGAGQVVLLGPPNGGKSALLAAMTNADPEVGAWPFTTRKPLPGMARFEDAPIQLVDAPATEHGGWQPWMSSLLRNADLGLLVLDPGAVGVLDALETAEGLVASSKLGLVPAWWTVRDLARLIHKDLAARLRFARIWGAGYHDGQKIPREHVLADRDVVEMHT